MFCVVIKATFGGEINKTIHANCMFACKCWKVSGGRQTHLITRLKKQDSGTQCLCDRLRQEWSNVLVSTCEIRLLYVWLTQPQNQQATHAALIGISPCSRINSFVASMAAPSSWHTHLCRAWLDHKNKWIRIEIKTCSADSISNKTITKCIVC